MRMQNWMICVLALAVGFSGLAQEKKQMKMNEQFPVFKGCENLNLQDLENCFYSQIQDFIFLNFVVPDAVKQNNYEGKIKVLFEVDETGKFKVLYVDAVRPDLVKATQAVFDKFPTILPATYNGKPLYSKYTLTLAVPLKSAAQLVAEKKTVVIAQQTQVVLAELDSIVYKKFDNPDLDSNLNIPFSHAVYAQFDPAMNQMGANNHTASKPYTYAEVAKYYNIKEANQKLNKPASGWWSKKFWNENMVAIQGEDYWFTLNPIVDLQAGTDASASKYTYINTRALNFRGGLGKNLNFTTTVFESQGRFASYFNAYANALKPSGGNPAIVPGMGIAKDFESTGYDFPLAEANITFKPGKHMDFQLGYGRNFIGDGYRSLLLSDGASPYPYFKMNTNFWKIKYTNTFMWLKDVRPEVTIERTYATKFMANHYLSWNVSNRLNLGFFESVIWTDTNNRGFDASFVNPIIFYRSVEFSSSSKSGNAVLALTGKYKVNNQINAYTQFLIDEFSVGDVKKANGSWKNKFAYQLGVKYFNAFQVENLLLQLEFNHVRPYVYSHSNAITNYGHNNQSLGHQWGGNLQEFIVIARYNKGRLFASTKFTFGKRGLDFDTPQNNLNYGGNIYKNYDLNRYADINVSVGQGNTTNIFIADVQAGYLINPSTNLKFFGSLICRNFNPNQETGTIFKQNTTWFSVGLRSDVFNWYFDY